MIRICGMEIKGLTQTADDWHAFGNTGEVKIWFNTLTGGVWVEPFSRWAAECGSGSGSAIVDLTPKALYGEDYLFCGYDSALSYETLNGKKLYLQRVIGKVLRELAQK